MLHLVVFLLCEMAAVLFMTLMFLIAKNIKRYDVVDAAWGLVFIVIGLVSFALQPGEIWQFDAQTLTTALVIIWGVRLSQHIARRIRNTSEEDKRYVELRKNWQGNVDTNMYFRVYLVQGFLALIVMTPVILINTAADTLTGWTYVGAVIWLVGFVFEATSDRQLRNFIRNPANKGKIMGQGLWEYSRHPNYFGELTQWWGIFVICLGVSFGWVGIIGPLLISYLILFVSGIPLNEKHFEGRPGWVEYKKRTSVILPLPPKTE